MKRIQLLILSLIIVLALMIQPVKALETRLFDEPLSLAGYMTQGASYGLEGKHYDTERGFQSFLWNLFLEGKYTPYKDLQLYASTKMTADWIYQVKADGRQWNDQLFEESHGHLNFDDKYWQVLNEAHVTWSSENFMMRIGKQIVSWGQTDGFRLMDQINPIDQRRGFSDVKFENTIIPVWLARGEYSIPVMSKWLQEIGAQFVFNPNAKFIPNQALFYEVGNDVGGIWSPNVVVYGPFPGGKAHLGSPLWGLKSPSSFDPEGFEYAAKIEAMLWNAVVTLNGFYGRNLDPVWQTVGAPVIGVASDGELLLHLPFKGYYAPLKFLGATFTRDVPFLKIPFGGAPEPVLRLEVLYEFDNASNTAINTIEKHDELHAAIGMDWKVKIDPLNPKASFLISAQFYDRKIFNYPTNYLLSDMNNPTLYANNYMTTLLVNTSYFNARLVPTVFWMHSIDCHADFYKLDLAYDYTHNWHFNVGALLFAVKQTNQSFQLFKDKNQIYFKAEYKWD